MAGAMNSKTPQVVTYKNAKAFERDGKRRFPLGWTVAAQSQSAGRITATRVATLGVGALFAKKDRGLTVTWMPPVATAAPVARKSCSLCGGGQMVSYLHQAQGCALGPENYCARCNRYSDSEGQQNWMGVSARASAPVTPAPCSSCGAQTAPTQPPPKGIDPPPTRRCVNPACRAWQP